MQVFCFPVVFLNHFVYVFLTSCLAQCCNSMFEYCGAQGWSGCWAKLENPFLSSIKLPTNRDEYLANPTLGTWTNIYFAEVTGMNDAFDFKVVRTTTVTNTNEVASSATLDSSNGIQPSTIPTTTGKTIDQDAEMEEEHMEMMVKTAIGASIGGAMAVALLIGSIFFFRWRCKQKKAALRELERPQESNDKPELDGQQEWEHRNGQQQWQEPENWKGPPHDEYWDAGGGILMAELEGVQNFEGRGDI